MTFGSQSVRGNGRPRQSRPRGLQARKSGEQIDRLVAACEATTHRPYTLGKTISLSGEDVPIGSSTWPRMMGQETVRNLFKYYVAHKLAQQTEAERAEALERVKSEARDTASYDEDDGR